MSARSAFSPITALVGLTAMISVVSCSPDLPTDASPSASLVTPSGKVAICHGSGTAARIIQVPSSALATHLAHGDYVTSLFVDHHNQTTGDGMHFTRITDALATARAGRLGRGETQSAACRVTITVAAGVFLGTVNASNNPVLEHFPFVVDVPDITLHGALRMGIDARGRATGSGTGHTESTLFPVEPLGDDTLTGASTPLIIANGHPDGSSAGHGLIVEGFVFQSGHVGVDDVGNGQAVFALRVRGLVIQGNRIEAQFSEGMDLRAASAVVQRNHIAGTYNTCDICLAGPGAFQVTDNRILGGQGIDGIISSPVLGIPEPAAAEPYDLPAVADITALISNNEIRDHLAAPVGVGIRVAAIGLFGEGVRSSSHYTIQGNTLANERFGMIIDAGFPAPEALVRGDMDIVLGGNAITQSCQASLLVSFARHTTGLGLKPGPYVLNSTYRLTLNGDLRWGDVWFSHPAGFANALVVDGQAMPNGQRTFYSAEQCPGLAP